MDDDKDIARHLNHLEVPVTPSRVFTDRLRHRLEGELAMTAHASDAPLSSIVTLPAPVTPNSIRHVPARSGRAVLPALGAAVCVLAVAAFYLLVISQASSPAPGVGADARYAIYTMAGALTRIDPTTLADRDQLPERRVRVVAQGNSIASSADGSVIAIVEPVHDGDQTTYRIAVIETKTGTERLSIPWRYPIESIDLSANGSRLVVGTMSGTTELGPGWHVYDTNTGSVLSHVESGGDSAHGWTQLLRTAVDSDGQRLYRLIVPNTRNSWNSSISEHLIVDDLATGEEIGIVELSGFRAGVVPSVDPFNFELIPAMAITGDGTKLVLVNAIDDAVTVVDTVGLRVERTVNQRPARDAIGQTLAFLGLSPEPAAAKGVGGVVLEAKFAPDGGYLYVWDASPRRMSPEGDSLLTDRRGLRVIDRRTGEIVREGFADSHILDVVPAPDGNGSFVTVVTGYDERGSPGSFALWRLDSDLIKTAERRYTVEPHVIPVSIS